MSFALLPKNKCNFQNDIFFLGQQFKKKIEDLKVIFIMKLKNGLSAGLVPIAAQQ